MGNESKLRTGWVCIASAGATVDDREIKPEWLTSMAETYDPEFYCAQIWPEHQRGYAMGDVLALKTEEVDGVLKLFAQLSPTRDLVYYNQVGQYKFCSIEPVEDFAGNGKFYLIGLGITNTPASTGTTRLQFNAAKPGPTLIGASEQLILSATEQDANTEAEAKTLFSRLLKFLSTHGEDNPSTDTGSDHPHSAPTSQEEEEPMNEKQFNELKGLITGIASKQEELEGKLASFSAGGPAGEDGEPGKPAADQGQGGDKPATGITTEQFSELLTAVKGVASKQGDLETKFAELLQEKPGQGPSGNPAGQSIPLV